MKDKRASESELKVLNILLKSEAKLTVREMIAILESEGTKWATRTVSTFLERMERKGLVGHERRGITNYYYALVEDQAYRHKEAKSFLDSRFNGSIRQFLTAFVEEDGISDEALDEIREWMKEFDD